VLAPLAGWTLLALLIWRGLFGSDLSREAAALLTRLLLFVSTTLYIWLACRDGRFSRAALLTGPLGVLLSLLVSLFLEGGEASLLRSVFFLLAAPPLGDLVSRLVDRREYLLPALLVAVVADVWSVYFGLSGVLVETGTHTGFTVAYPVAGRPEMPPLPMVGIMDWIFVAFLVCTTVRFDLPRWALGPALALGLAAGGAVLALLQEPVPLLGTIAPAYGLLYLPHLKPRRRDLLVTIAFLAVLVALFAAVSWLRRG
jgi:hypothetical protein